MKYKIAIQNSGKIKEVDALLKQAKAATGVTRSALRRIMAIANSRKTAIRGKKTK